MMFIIKAITYCTTIIFSLCCYADGAQITIKVPCSKNFMAAVEAPWVMYPGVPGAQYTLTTVGLLDSAKGESVMEVHKEDGFLSKTHDNVNVSVEAKCVPRDVGADISSTGSSLSCDISEGIKIKMYSPTNVDPNKYNYVGVLTIDKDEIEPLCSIEAITSGIGSINLLPTIIKSGVQNFGAF